MIEFNLFHFGHLYNLDHGIMVLPYNNSIVMNLKDIIVYSDNYEEIYENLVTMAHVLQNLELTEEESVLAAGLCVVIAGKMNLCLLVLNFTMLLVCCCLLGTNG